MVEQDPVVAKERPLAQRQPLHPHVQQRGDDVHGDIWAAKHPSLRSLAASSAAADWRGRIPGLRFEVLGHILLAADLPVRGGFSRRISSASVRANKAHSGRWRPIGRCKGSVKSRAARSPRAISEAKRSSNQRALRPVAAVAALDEPGRGREAHLGHHDRRQQHTRPGMVLVAAPSKVAK
jgi:hypothetical protein